MTIEKTNLGVKPLGRGEEISEVVQFENNCLKEFKNELATIGYVNSPEAAAKYRNALVKYYDKINKGVAKNFRKICKSLNLSV